MSNGNFRNERIPLKKFFSDSEKEIINPELVDKAALDVAKQFEKNGLNKNQLRKYYSEIKNIEKMFILKGSKWEPVEPFVKMVKSKVYYGKGRKMRVDKLAEFLEIYINKIEDAKDFRAFCKLFESVVGYFYGISRK